jgi:hypothetical protein
MLAAEHFLRLGDLDFLLQLVERACKIRCDVLTRIRPFDEDRKVVAPPLEGVTQRQVFLKPPLPLQRLLCFRLIVPEIR